ncbi:MAG: hypothetical protein QOI77_1321 [Blastocatellia bacterium]|nr:hypothetical protein [Blastocatellia bacterium]
MNIRISIKKRYLLLLSICSVLAITSNIRAQPKWRVYTSPNKSFSVELPWNPNYVRRNTAGMVGGPGGVVAFRGTWAEDIYNLSMYIDEEHTSFVIRVYNLSARDSEKEFDAEGKLTPITSGRQKPDEWQENPVTINGLRGREVIYKKGKVASRLLIVFADHRIYQVEFVTEDKRGISRGPVNRVFGTFQPVP